MNKKIVIIVVLIECIAAILLVSFWGKMVESRNPVVVPTEVYFTDKDGNRLENDATVQIELTDRNRDYQLYWVVVPDNATNKEVEFLCNNGEEEVIISKSGRVTFFVNKVAVITVRTKDGEQSAKITLVPPRN